MQWAFVELIVSSFYNNNEMEVLMQQHSRTWFESLFVKFDFAKFEVQRVVRDNVDDFEIRHAILFHLASLFDSDCPGEDCVEAHFREPDFECKVCPHSLYVTDHKSDLGFQFSVETWVHGWVTRVFLP